MSEQKYPHGKLNEGDEGEIAIGVTVDQDCVIVAFRKPVAWVGMPAEQAEQLADTLRERAKEARRNRQ